MLARAFLHTLLESRPQPDTIICINGGVRLAVTGEPTAEDLAELACRGCRVLLCGTCVDFFAIKDKLAAGEVSNMYAITELLLGAAKVVRP